MKKFKFILVVVLIIAMVIIGIPQIASETNNETIENNKAMATTNETTPESNIRYTSLGVPNINSSFKSWMSYTAITNKKSPQYKFINSYGWIDREGFLRCDKELSLGVEEDYYLIALGSYYGTTIGNRYRITLDTGRVFYGVLADCKADIHTNSTNQYVPTNGNVVEFLVDTKTLNKNIKRSGSANVYMPLNGIVAKIERINLINE